MKISVLKNAIIVEVDSAKHIDSSKAFSFILNHELGSITVEKEREWIATAKLEETTVNDTQLTAENAENLLASLLPNTGCCCGGSGSSSIIYIADTAELPATATIDDLAALTTDGTEAGELLELYRWNGFEWILESMKANLVVSYTGLSDYKIIPDPVYNVTFKTLSANGKRYYYVKSKDNNPILLEQTGVLEGIPKVYNPNGGFYFKDMNAVLTEKDNSLSDVFMNGDSQNGLTISSSAAISAIQDKTFSFTDSNVGYININDSNIKSVLLKNLTFTAAGSIYIQEAGYEDITIENITGCTGISIYPNPDLGVGITKTISVKDVDFINGYISLRGSHEKVQATSIHFENVTFGDTYRITGLQLNEMTFTNCNGNDMIRIELDSLSFPSQIACDNIFTRFLDIVSSGVTVYLGTKDYAPSQSVRNAYSAKGVSLEISQQ